MSPSVTTSEWAGRGENWSGRSVRSTSSAVNRTPKRLPILSPSPKCEIQSLSRAPYSRLSPFSCPPTTPFIPPGIEPKRNHLQLGRVPRALVCVCVSSAGAGGPVPSGVRPCGMLKMPNGKLSKCSYTIILGASRNRAGLAARVQKRDASHSTRHCEGRLYLFHGRRLRDMSPSSQSVTTSEWEGRGENWRRALPSRPAGDLPCCEENAETLPNSFIALLPRCELEPLRADARGSRPARLPVRFSSSSHALLRRCKGCSRPTSSVQLVAAWRCLGFSASRWRRCGQQAAVAAVGGRLPSPLAVCVDVDSLRYGGIVELLPRAAAAFAW